MTDSPRLTPQILHQIALALNDGEIGAIENLAGIVRRDPATVAAWCAGTEPIPGDVLSQVLSMMGGTTPTDPAWRRDEWVLGTGPTDASSNSRRYLFHILPPRFRCRAIDRYVDTGNPYETEEPVDTSNGIVYPDDYPFEHFQLVEFEWIDPPPRPDHLVNLLDEAVHAYLQLTTTTTPR